MEKEIGGPSAGLACAVAIYDMLEPGDVAAGWTIGATGTISPSGEVGEVGGVEQKVAALETAGADLFLVPESEVGRARAEGVKVRGVGNLEEAIEVLRPAA